MAAKSESVTERGSAWSWSRAREVAVVFGAGLTGVGVLLAGLIYTAQPLREDVRILQATMVEVRERLVRVEEGQARPGEGQARLDESQVRLDESQVRLEEGQVRLQEDIGRILVLLARRTDG